MSNIRQPIRVSWERSAASAVDADQPDPTYVELVAEESMLTRIARPVLAALSTELANEPVCLILTDAHATVLFRAGGDSSLLRALDAVRLAPGFRYAETEVGTNGIGTALEVGGPILVDGREHYTGGLQSFSCAGALITHPVTGRVLGVIDITTRAGNSNPLLVSFAKLAARRIQDRILEEANELEGALLSGYYAACRHSGGPVLAVSDKVFMMNAVAQQRFDANDQAALLLHTRETIGRTGPWTIVTDLPSGATARLAYQPTFVGDALAGGVIQVKEQRDHRTAGTPGPGIGGLVGSSPAWRRASREVLDAASTSEWVVLEGEAGSGKLVLLTAAHRHVASSRRLSVLDASQGDGVVDQAASELEAGADLVISHAHRLSGAQRSDLGLLFQEVQATASAHGPWVALTREAQTDEDIDLHLLHFFPRTVSVPPLRHHLDDVPELVALLLKRAGAPDLTFAKPAMNQLMRLPWPGNVTQLRQTLISIARTRRSGVVQLDELPAECRATTRRKLTRMEVLERDAIVEALALRDGDKAAAAASLGMSRATIYRKIRDYGIVT